MKFQGETCDSITQQFQNEVGGPVYGPGSPNPDLLCDSLSPGQLVLSSFYLDFCQLVIN